MTISEYLRKLFNSYILLTQDERERIVFNEEIDLINRAIKENKKSDARCSSNRSNV